MIALRDGAEGDARETDSTSHGFCNRLLSAEDALRCSGSQPVAGVVTPHEVGTRRDRLPSLTGMRFVGALMVFFHHGIGLGLFADRDVQATSLSAVKYAGPIGVTFFFVLSGFVLTASARPDDSVKAFYRRRLLKIYPNHVATFALAMVLYAAASTPALHAALNLLLLQAWVPDKAVMLSVNAPSWSLSCELFFYAAFPLLLRLVGKIRPDRLWWWAGAAVAAVFALAVITTSFLPGTPIISQEQPVSAYQFWFSYTFPVTRALVFVLGMLMARIVLTDRWIGFGLGQALVLCVAAYIGTVNVPYVVGLTAAMIVPLALLVPAAAVADVRGTWSPFRSRVMIRAGELSFAFYLVHGIVLVGIRSLVGTRTTWSTPSATGVLITALVESLLLAWLLFVLVEQPAMRRWSRPARSSGRTPQPPQPRPLRRSGNRPRAGETP